MLKFYKYQGTGNDFIIFDSFHNEIPEFSSEIIRHLCDRRFGIGADGLMILKKHPVYDFEMEYFNSDGSGTTMCGNGGRCIVSLAVKLGYVKKNVKFYASDGIHEASYLENEIIDLKMNDVDQILKDGDDYSCYTGSPHLLLFVKKTDLINVFELGRNIRYSDKYKNYGTNINFIEIIDQNKLKIRTYERGVEDETFSCGTGSVASALTYAELNEIKSDVIEVNVKGGKLLVSFEKSDERYINIGLKGPAKFVYEGYINVNEL